MQYLRAIFFMLLCFGWGGALLFKPHLLPHEEIWQGRTWIGLTILACGVITLVWLIMEIRRARRERESVSPLGRAMLVPERFTFWRGVTRTAMVGCFFVGGASLISIFKGDPVPPIDALGGHRGIVSRIEASPNAAAAGVRFWFYVEDEYEPYRYHSWMPEAGRIQEVLKVGDKVTIAHRGGTNEIWGFGVDEGPVVTYDEMAAAARIHQRRDVESVLPPAVFFILLGVALLVWRRRKYSEENELRTVRAEFEKGAEEHLKRLGIERGVAPPRKVEAVKSPVVAGSTSDPRRVSAPSPSPSIKVDVAPAPEPQSTFVKLGRGVTLMMMLACCLGGFVYLGTALDGYAHSNDETALRTGVFLLLCAAALFVWRLRDPGASSSPPPARQPEQVRLSRQVNAPVSLASLSASMVVKPMPPLQKGSWASPSSPRPKPGRRRRKVASIRPVAGDAAGQRFFRGEADSTSI